MSVIKDRFLNLNKENIEILKEIHLNCNYKKTADKIKSILLMANGFSSKQVEEILLLDERTLNRYVSIYMDKGIDGLIANNYSRYKSYFDKEQTIKLERELENKTYKAAKEVCKYVLEASNVKYTINEMYRILHRLGYNYYVGYGWAKNGSRFEIKNQLTKYETIFDHNITENERKSLTKAKTKEDYLIEVNYNQKKCYSNLYSLYCIREDFETADKYYYEARGRNTVYCGYRKPKDNEENKKSLLDDNNLKDALKKAKNIALGSF